MEFVLVFIICPITVVIASTGGYSLAKRWFVMPIITFIVFTILTFAVFNESFFFWVIIYTVLSIIVSLSVKFKKK